MLISSLEVITLLKSLFPLHLPAKTFKLKKNAKLSFEVFHLKILPSIITYNRYL